MAIKCVKREWCAEADGYRHEFVMDSADDFANLPESCPGSTAYTADANMDTYMVNASGVWTKI